MTTMATPVPITPTAIGRTMTADEFLDLPRPEPGWQELIAGVVVGDVHGPGLDHQLALGELFAHLHAWTSAAPDRGFAVLDIDTGLDERHVLRPDLQWFAAGRNVRDLGRRSLPVGDLVVEARSPSTRDIGVKRRLYEQHGAREYWLVDVVAHTVVQLRRATPDAPVFDDGVEVGEGEELTSTLLPGFAVAVADVFADPTAS